MSKHLVQQTEYNDQGCLKEALEQVGVPFEFDENGGLEHIGYSENFTGAQFRITKDALMEFTKGHSFSDLSFKRNGEGKFDMLFDDLSIKRPENEQFVNGLTVTYSEKKYCQEMCQAGFIMQGRTQNEDGSVDLNFQELSTF